MFHITTRKNPFAAQLPQPLAHVGAHGWLPVPAARVRDPHRRRRFGPRELYPEGSRATLATALQKKPLQLVKKDGTVAITVSPLDGANRIRFLGSRHCRLPISDCRLILLMKHDLNRVDQIG